MAKINFVLQGIAENENHEASIIELLSPEFAHYLLCLAFVRRSGVERIIHQLPAQKTKLFVGVRNGVTSVQGIFSLLRGGIMPFAVDTASSQTIFHPKIYAAYNEKHAQVIIGSANLTFGGLNRNVEASAHIRLCREEQSDEAFLNKLISGISSLTEKYPKHVFQIATGRQAVKLLKEGRLEDERFHRPMLKGIVSDNQSRKDGLPPLSILHREQQPSNIARRSLRSEPSNAAILVWESKPLTERSLNIPEREGTHVTGDFNLGQGTMEDIDFQHYFRNDVFSGLQWQTDSDSRSPQLERSEIEAEIVIRNLSYGTCKLEVTHDPRTDTASYKQRNATTKIKWGQARQLVSRKDLLGGTMRLYRKSPRNFIIEIE